MKSQWKQYLLYVSLTIVGGGLLLILIEAVRTKNTGFETKTLWDWMELLIIPLVLAVGAFLLNRSERETERDIAKDRQQEAALQAYIDRMSGLLLEHKLRTINKVEVRDVARTRTVSVMRGLDPKRNDLVIQFLREAKLITDENSILNGADMEGMNLQGLNLAGVYLQKATCFDANMQETILIGANLQGTILNKANLQRANLRGANLSDAILSGTDLFEAILSGADLSRTVFLQADLRKADLSEVDLQDANLKWAKLKGANLYQANLQNANITNEQLATTKSFYSPGVAMLDGSKRW